MKKQTKLVAVLSASVLLAIGASMTSMAATTGWKEENGVWQYISRDGYAVTEEWKKSGSNYYWLDENGEMAVDTLVDDGDSKYYVNASGVRVVNEWRQVDNEDAWTNGYNDYEPNTVWYYFGSTGKAQTGKKTINGKTYIFDASGEMFSGWTEYKDKTYYLGDENEGFAYTGWHYLELKEEHAGEYDNDEGWYNFKSSGELRKASEAGKTVRAYIGGAYYGFDHNGVMVDGWVPPEEATSTAAAYYSEDSGAQKKGWVLTNPNVKDGDEKDPVWFYLNSKGKPFNVGGYFSDDMKEKSKGVVVKHVEGKPGNKTIEEVAAKVISSKTYLFDKTGEMLTGVYELQENVNRVGGSGDLVKGGIYYFNKSGGSSLGQMETGKVTVTYDGENYYYYFQKNGQAYTNIIVDNTLYKKNGTRLNADENREIVTLSFDDFDEDIKVNNNENIVLHPGDKVVVSSTGALRRSGSITIDGQKYTVKDYVATPDKTAKK